jgi:signal peptidase I
VLVKSHPSPFIAIVSALVLVLLGAVWVAFAPIQFGGHAAYVIVAGNSMEPGMHLGDLVILRRTSDYEVGDVVTYRHPEIGPIIHRVIAREGDRYLFQGDNNGWVDSYQPVESELIGEQWVYLPSAGKLLEKARTPRGMTLLATAFGIATVTGMAGEPETWPGRRRGRKQARAQRASASTSALSQSRAEATFALATLAFASLLLGWFAFSRPLSRDLTDDLAYEHTAQFDYTAPVPLGVYDSYNAQAGDPIYRRLTSRVDVNFTYQFLSDLPEQLGGTVRLVAEIGDGNGWVRTMELQPEARFSGASFAAEGALDLTQVQTFIDSFEQQTAIQRSYYIVAVVPQIVLNGTLAGEPFEDEFAPRLEFQLDPLQMSLANRGEGTDPLSTTQQGLFPRTRTEPNKLSLLSLTLPVSTARWLAVAGFVLSLAGAVALGLPMFRAARGDEAARIRVRYAALLVNVRDSGRDPAAPLIEVSAIEDMAKLAERDGRMILHEQRGLTHDYYVRDGNLTYHYRANAPIEDAAPLRESETAW